MVEPANGIGEPTREIGYRTKDGVPVWFRNIARGKRSLKINLKDAEALAFFLSLVSTADVLIEAFRPGVVARLGIDYARPQRSQSKARLLLDLGVRAGRPFARPPRARPRHSSPCGHARARPRT